MSWGLRITLLYLGFVAIILTLVVISYGNTSELESKDYYARELKFQEQINATENTSRLAEPIRYKVVDRSVQIQLPKEILAGALNGTIYFLRPSDSSKDKSVPLAVNGEGFQVLDSGFEKGVYKMQISLRSGDKNYYKEAVINFN